MSIVLSHPAVGPQGVPGKRAIAVAPNGGRKTHVDHPAVPLDAKALAQVASASLEAGAAMIHVHVRRADGGHLLDAGAYGDAIAAIRQAVGDKLLIQITSEALGHYRPEEQIAVVKATRPPGVSLALRELVPDEDHLPAFLDLLAFMAREHILPQIILYAPEDARALAALRDRGQLPFADIPVLYVLGRYSTSQIAEPSELLPFVSEGMPRFAHWSLCAFGPQECACVTAAALLGGHIRVGFENNLMRASGVMAKGNEDLVADSSNALKACGFAPMDADSLRSSIMTAMDRE